MKRLVVVLIAIALPAPVWSQTERGLVGSWSFDEGQGREVHDASTGGHPGHVRGGAMGGRTPRRRVGVQRGRRVGGDRRASRAEP